MEEKENDTKQANLHKGSTWNPVHKKKHLNLWRSDRTC
jgi:hypothetical protein